MVGARPLADVAHLLLDNGLQIAHGRRLGAPCLVALADLLLPLSQARQQAQIEVVHHPRARGAAIADFALELWVGCRTQVGVLWRFQLLTDLLAVSEFPQAAATVVMSLDVLLLLAPLALTCLLYTSPSPRDS